MDRRAVYTVSIEKKADNTYYATFQEEGSAAVNEKTFKASDSALTPDIMAQFGLAVYSADVTVTDMVLSDMSGNVLYDQNRDNSGQEESGYKPQVSGSDLLTVTGAGSVMKAEQSAESGSIHRVQVMQESIQVTFYCRKMMHLHLCP